MTQRKILLAIAAGAWALCIILWPSPTNLSGPSSPHTDGTTSGEGLYKASITKANFGLLGVRFYETDENRKRWNIKSRFAELHRKEDYAFLEEVDADFYAERTGNLVVTRSDRGLCYLDKNEVELEGNVTVQSKRGYLFSMERLRYEGKTHEFFSEDPVDMKGPDINRPTMLLKGVGLKADIDREYFNVKKDVVAQKRLKTNEWLRINSRRAEFFTDDQHAFFEGKVKSVLPSLELLSDQLEIVIEDEKELINARTFKGAKGGQVLLKTKKRTGRADSVFIEAGNSIITLEGRASVDTSDGQIRGTKIRFDTEADRVDVEKAEGRINQ